MFILDWHCCVIDENFSSYIQQIRRSKIQQQVSRECELFSQLGLIPEPSKIDETETGRRQNIVGEICLSNILNTRKRDLKKEWTRKLAFSTDHT